MRTRDLIPVWLLGGLALFVAALVLFTKEPVSPAAAAVRDARRGEPTPVATPTLSVDEVRQRIATGAPGTFIDSLLGTDSLLVRWDVGQTPIQVWIQETSHLPAFRSELPTEARDAFAVWQQVLPLRFLVTNDSAAAQIVVRWTDALGAGRQIGNTERSYDEVRGAIVRASILLALRDHRGARLSAGTQHVALMHEIGHALGLEHSGDARDVMATEFDGSASTLSAADVATARLLYSLPPGRVR